MGILNDKVVLVTGAGRGVGRGHALTLAEEGALVVVNDLGCGVAGQGADVAPAQEVVDIIESRGGSAITNGEDISSWEGARRAVQAGIEAFGRLDGVVNNAGILRQAEIADVSEADFDALTAVHLKGTFGCMRHACAYWRDEARAGRTPRAAIVNTVSDSMLLTLPFDSVYGAAKAATAHVTLAGSLEAAAYGVRMNAIAPRAMTRITAASPFVDSEGIEAKEAEHYTDASPMNPAQSSPLVAWLLSDQSAHVTGQVFRTLAGAVGRARPWEPGELVWPEQGRTDYRPGEIGEVVDTRIFGSRHGRRLIEYAPGDPRKQASWHADMGAR